MLQLAQELGWLTDSLSCEGMQECFEEHEGELYVKGTGRSYKLPDDPPLLRRDAVFDSREAFDTLRYGLLEFKGKNLNSVKDICEALLAANFGALAQKDELRRFRTLQISAF